MSFAMPFSWPSHRTDTFFWFLTLASARVTYEVSVTINGGRRDFFHVVAPLVIFPPRLRPRKTTLPRACRLSAVMLIPAGRQQRSVAQLACTAGPSRNFETALLSTLQDATRKRQRSERASSTNSAEMSLNVATLLERGR
jgi:hypothetical protein